MSKTIRHGDNVYRTTVNGGFEIQCFGWHPFGPNPRYSWQAIEADKVPAEVRRLA